MINQTTCSLCGYKRVPKSEIPKRCPKCYKNQKSTIYKPKYVKNPTGKNVIKVSDKCYSMLLRRKKSQDEKTSNVIKRLVFENKFSLLIRYKEEPKVHEIRVSPDLKMQLFEIANKHNIKTPNEVIWRLL